LLLLLLLGGGGGDDRHVRDLDDPAAVVVSLHEAEVSCNDFVTLLYLDEAPDDPQQKGMLGARRN
jgi:hypothetical protein